MLKVMVLALLPVLAYSAQDYSFHEINKDDPKAQKVLNAGMKLLNAQDDHNFLTMAVYVGIVSAKTERGRLYTFENVVLQDTGCSNTSEDHKKCAADPKLNPEGATQMCILQVLERLWLDPEDQYQLVKYDCKDFMYQ